MKISCKCCQVVFEVLKREDADNTADKLPSQYKIIRNLLEIPKNLKRINDSFYCFVCKEEILRVYGGDVLYNLKLENNQSHGNLVDFEKENSLKPLKVTELEKQNYLKELELRKIREISFQKELADKKIDDILLQFQVYKQNVEEIVKMVEGTLVVEEVECVVAPEIPPIADTTATSKTTPKFTKGDEIFLFDELDNDDDKDLPSDLESEGNETPEEIPEPVPNPHPSIFGSLPIQITVNRSTPAHQVNAKEDKTFEPPHVFAARTFQETGIAMRPGSLSRRVSFL